MLLSRRCRQRSCRGPRIVVDSNAAGWATSNDSYRADKMGIGEYGRAEYGRTLDQGPVASTNIAGLLNSPSFKSATHELGFRRIAATVMSAQYFSRSCFQMQQLGYDGCGMSCVVPPRTRVCM